jgi:hypothetical protein
MTKKTPKQFKRALLNLIEHAPTMGTVVITDLAQDVIRQGQFVLAPLLKLIANSIYTD